MKVLVTGATGIVGSEVCTALQSRGDVELVAASRRGDEASDVLAWDLLAGPPAPVEVDAVVHCAADTRWNRTEDEALDGNVRPLETLSKHLPSDVPFILLSTAFVLGVDGTTCSVRSEDYRNTYEWSKAYAERTATELFADCRIVRPSFVVGRRSDCGIVRRRGLYTMIKAIGSGILPAVIGKPDSTLDIAPVDELADLVLDVLFRQAPDDPIVETIGTGSDSPEVSFILDQIVTTTNRRRSEQGFEEITAPPIVALERWERLFRPLLMDEANARQQRVIELLEAFVPYTSGEIDIEPTVTVANPKELLSTIVCDEIVNGPIRPGTSLWK